MKWYVKCCCLEEAWRKVFRISRMVLVFPLNDDCRFSPKSSIAPAIILLASSIHSVYWISKGEIFHKNVFHKCLFIFRKLLLTSCCITIACQLVLRQENFRLILNNFKMIDSGLVLLNKRQITALNLAMYLFNIFVSILVIISQSFTDPPLYWLELHIETVLLAVFINQMLAFCDLLKYLFQQISEFPCCESNKNYTLRTKLYNIIEDSKDNLNEAYGIGIFFIITVFFITILHQFFQFFQKKLETTWEIVNAFVTSACYLWLIVQLILASSGVNSKATTFNNSLYKELLKDGTKHMPSYEEIYFHFERVKELRLSANGFFLLDQHLIISMMVTGTTYLVILLQYSD